MEEIVNYDSWKLDSEQEEDDFVGYCSQCGGEIYVGDRIIDVDGDLLHDEGDDCFTKYAMKKLGAKATYAEKG